MPRIYTRTDPIDRLIAQAKKLPSGCIEWQGFINRDGYGYNFWFFDRPQLAHRASYILLVGPIPESLTIDHLCRNRRCINPTHLQAVTHNENNFRGLSPPALNRAKTHCSHGHAYDADNTYFAKDGSRRCRACGRNAFRLKKGLDSSKWRKM